MTHLFCSNLRMSSEATLFSFSLSLSFHLLSFVHPNVDGQHKHLSPPAAVKWLLAFLPVRVINFACFGTDKLLSFIIWGTVHWYISPNWVIKEELCYQLTLMSFIVIEWTYEVRRSNRIQQKLKRKWQQTTNSLYQAIPWFISHFGVV